MKKTIKLVVGWVFLILGVISGFIPILQGWMFIGVGLLMLADESVFIKKLLHPLEQKYPTQFQKAHEFKNALFLKLRNLIQRHKRNKVC